MRRLEFVAIDTERLIAGRMVGVITVCVESHRVRRSEAGELTIVGGVGE